MSDVYVVINIATTCDETNTYVTKDSTELIEFSWSTIDAVTTEVLHKESILVKPTNTPITPYCSQLHKLTWEHVRNAGTFKDAIQQFDNYVQVSLINNNKSFVFVTMDLKSFNIQVPREARDKSIVLPSYLQMPKIFDLSIEYSKWQLSHPESLSYPELNSSSVNGSSTVELLSNLAALTSDSSNLTTPSLTPNSTSSTKSSLLTSIYSKILIQLIKKSLPIEEHQNVLTKPYDFEQDVKMFLSERSKILYLSNLSNDTTQSELESWFTQYGGRPIAFWTIKNLESSTNSKSKSNGISGFAVFSTHEEATESLSMNGKVFNDRPIEVQPSSTKVLDKASDLLTPFPPSKNRPRPGDWTCPSCGFSNFQRRTHCFRCSFPASSAVAIQESIYSSNSDQQQQYNLHSNGNGHNNLNYNNNHLNSINNNGNNNNNLNNANNNMNNNHNRLHYNNNNVPFRAGDWKCDYCTYHNFAKNLCCLKCGANK
ncbi:hypothetical protein DFJ63DRAFT_288778, partial [Scheffersomyces coipomensis]|uniref:uncharacterized protein n=1 Tax=Scheffersomyces coipomensis TaxID=1788519 RepID=UPI00315CD69A